MIASTKVYMYTILQKRKLHLRIGIQINLVEEAPKIVSFMTREKTTKRSGMTSIVQLEKTVSFARSP